MSEVIKRTTIFQIEVQPESGYVFIHMYKRAYDGERVVSEGNHRTVLEPDTDIDAQAEMVNNQLAQMGEAPVDLAEWEYVRKCAEIARTPEVVSRWAAKRKAEQDEAKAAALLRAEAEAKAKAEEKARFDAAVSAAVVAHLEKGKAA